MPHAPANAARFHEPEWQFSAGSDHTFRSFHRVTDAPTHEPARPDRSQDEFYAGSTYLEPAQWHFHCPEFAVMNR